MAVVTFDDIVAARERIAPFIRRTPLHPLGGGPLMKLENLQITGSFKVRGAFNHVLARRNECEEGIITASSGNHGQAVAYVAKTLGIRAVVIVPENVIPSKAEAIVGHGAELIRFGRYPEDRVVKAQELAEERRLHYVPPYDDPLIIAGQGTAGLEIVEDCPDVETVVVPVSGGGLLSGIAAAVKSLRPEARVIGAEPAGADRFARSRQAGKPVMLERAETVADGLRALSPGRLTWEVTSQFVDDFRPVPDSAILAAVRRVLLDDHLLLEPSGAIAVAAALAAGLTDLATVAVASGGNIDPPILLQALQANR
ncbi:MAG TPA: threonine/serine dehydratase [bacterium]|nr:threonine/serine dehydratase [bacterium]